MKFLDKERQTRHSLRERERERYKYIRGKPPKDVEVCTCARESVCAPCPCRSADARDGQRQRDGTEIHLETEREKNVGSVRRNVQRTRLGLVEKTEMHAPLPCTGGCVWEGAFACVPL